MNGIQRLHTEAVETVIDEIGLQVLDEAARETISLKVSELIGEGYFGIDEIVDKFLEEC